MLAGLARDRPLILAFDDVQHMRPRELAGTAQLIRATQQLPVAFLLGHRAPLTPVLSQLCTRLVLGPFPLPTQRRLLEDLLGARELDEALVDLIAGSCEGNPFFIEEMAKYLVEEGRIHIEDERATLVGQQFQAGELPDGVSGLLHERIDSLDAASKGALQLAAIVGHTFDETLLAEAAGLDDPTPLVLSLARIGLIVRRDSGGGWAFASELIRHATLRGILGVQRRDYHRLVAHAIETLYADELDAFAEALTVHCAEGGRATDAALYAYKAGQALERRQLLERARAVYQTGLAALKDAEPDPDQWDARVQGDAMLHFRCGVVSLLLGDTRAGERALQISLDISSDAGLPWIEVRAHLELGRHYMSRAKNRLARAHLGQARALLRVEDDPGAPARGHRGHRRPGLRRGPQRGGRAAVERGADAAAGDPAAVARCEIGLANRHLRAGQYDQAEPLLQRALQTAREAGDRILEGRVLNNIGLVHSWARRFDEALVLYRQALEVREGIGYTRGVVINHHNVGDTHFQKGDWARAWVSFERSRELAAEMGWERGVVLNEVFMAYIDASRTSGGADAILAATERARSLGAAEITTTGSWLAGRYLLENGHHQAGRLQLEHALEDAARWGLTSMEGLIRDTLSVHSDPGPKPRAMTADHLG